ncbi:MAG: hypothetical protein DRR42_11555 [Gammaproteobacteria bacterium]|nr:MAG: hypothetical protein DRR42_11555 [Gammaproteobacteria bacterium]
MSKVTVKQQYWSEHLLQADAFDGSFAQYAQTHNIPVQTLYRWRHYFKGSPVTEPKTKPLFTQLVTSPVGDVCITLRMGNVQFQFNRLPDPQWLAEFITASHAP